jgi:hypothetical protein
VESRLIQRVVNDRVEVDPAQVAPLTGPTRAGELPTGRDLLLQALLHLPRIAGPDGIVGLGEAVEEIERVRGRRAALLEPVRSLAEPPPAALSLDELEVRMVAPTEAAPVLERFHYLGSVRPDALTMGAFARGRVVALCSISPLDLPAVTEHLPVDDPATAAVVSRVFAFDWAPRNVVSYLLARVASSREALPEGAQVLLTYLNPNMGFSGASYRAASWLPFARETGTRYAYLDGRYVTDRVVDSLPEDERERVEYSTMPLRPLILMCRLLTRRLQRAHPAGFDFVIRREPSRPASRAT